jgi:hypothetical protein
MLPAYMPIEKLAKKSLLEVNSSSWHALSKLLSSHLWFTRVWIIQEVVVASKVDFLYGSGILQWDLMYWAIRTFNRPQISGVLPGPTEYIRRNIASDLLQGGIVTLVRDKLQLKEKFSLREAATLCSKFQSTNPRDKIFALVGLVIDDVDFHSWVDYSKSPAEVFRDTARYLLAQEMNQLQVLHFAGIGYPCNLECLPSWVPDWSKSPYTLSLDGGLATIVYNAAGGYSQDPKISFSTDLSVIHLQGIQVDEIKVMVKDWQIYADNFTDKQIQTFYTHQDQWLQECQELIKEHVRYPYPTGQTRDEAFWRTLLGDRRVEGRPAPDTYAEYYKAFEESIFEIVDDRASFDIVAYLTLKAKKFLAISSGMIKGRIFYVTKNGYMGFVPPLTRVGEMVCIFSGANTPFVVRNLDSLGANSHMLVGECYFHGTMDGEMLANDRQMEVFTIQ